MPVSEGEEQVLRGSVEGKLSDSKMAVLGGASMDQLSMIASETQRWSEYLNRTVATTSIALAGGCVAMPNYLNLAGCALMIAMWWFLMDHGRPLFSKTLLNLRALAVKDVRTQEIISYAESVFLSGREFRPYMLGSISIVIATGYCFISVLLHHFQVVFSSISLYSAISLF